MSKGAPPNPLSGSTPIPYILSIHVVTPTPCLKSRPSNQSNKSQFRYPPNRSRPPKSRPSNQLNKSQFRHPPQTAGRSQSLFLPAHGEPVEPSVASMGILRQAQDEKKPIGDVTLQLSCPKPFILDPQTAHPELVEGGTTGGAFRKTAGGRDGMEFFPGSPIFSRIFPFRRQFGPDSKLAACYFSQRSSKGNFQFRCHFCPFRPMSTFWSTGMPHAGGDPDKRDQNKCVQQLPHQNGTRADKGQMSSNLPRQLPLCQTTRTLVPHTQAEQPHPPRGRGRLRLNPAPENRSTSTAHPRHPRESGEVDSNFKCNTKCNTWSLRFLARISVGV